MARRFTSDRNLPVAFNSSRATSIRNAISALGFMQMKLSKPDFEPIELLRLFVPPERRELLTEAYRIAAPRGFVNDLYVSFAVPQELGDKPMRVRFYWDNRTFPLAFLVPNDAGASEDKAVREIQPDVPAETGAKFARMFKDVVEVSYRFGLVAWVFNQLNRSDVCKTPQQMRYAWPCIVPLMAKAGYREDAAALAEPSARAGEKLVIPPHVHKHLKTSNDIVARAGFIEADQLPKDTRMTYRILGTQFLDGVEQFDGYV